MANPAAVDASAVHCKGVTVSSGVLRIDGVISHPESFRGALRVKATRAGRKPYFLLGGDLVSSDDPGKRRIVAGKVMIENRTEPLPFDKQKGKGRWRSIPVEVRDVRFASEYKGGLELGSGGCKVHFRLTVVGGADIALVGVGVKAVRLKLVTCRHATCAIGTIGRFVNSFISSPSSQRDSVEVPVENASQSPAEITSVQIAVSREASEKALSEEALVPPPSAYVGPQQAKALPAIGIERGEIEPGHYTGAIYLTVADAERRVLLPFELDVKDGPTWALAVLIAALAVQLSVEFAGWARSRKSALHELDRLRKRAKVTLGPDAVLLQPWLDEATETALKGQHGEANLKGKQIEKEIVQVEDAQALETKAVEEADDKQLRSVALAAGQFREAVRRKGSSDDQLKKLNQEVEAVVEESPHGPSTPPPGDEKPTSAAQRAGDLSWLGRAIIRFGVYILPGLVQAVLVVVFLLAGLKELYLSNSTFGSQVFVDYAGLFLWGLTAAGFKFALDGIRHMVEAS